MQFLSSCDKLRSFPFYPIKLKNNIFPLIYPYNDKHSHGNLLQIGCILLENQTGSEAFPLGTGRVYEI